MCCDLKYLALCFLCQIAGACCLFLALGVALWDAWHWIMIDCCEEGGLLACLMCNWGRDLSSGTNIHLRPAVLELPQIRSQKGWKTHFRLWRPLTALHGSAISSWVLVKIIPPLYELNKGWKWSFTHPPVVVFIPLNNEENIMKNFETGCHWHPKNTMEVKDYPFPLLFKICVQQNKIQTSCCETSRGWVSELSL